jgi:hypothetical protein
MTLENSVAGVTGMSEQIFRSPVSKLMSFFLPESESVEGEVEAGQEGTEEPENVPCQVESQS